MMIKKKLGVLAAAVAVASTANAAFDTGNAVLYAYADNDDSYFVDLGVTGQDLVNGATVDISDSGLAAFLSTNAGAQWSVIASVNDTASVGGPPSNTASLANSGVVSTSTSGSAVASSGSDNEVQRNTMNAWLADVQAAAGGSSSFFLAGTDPASADPARNGGFLNDSLIAVGSASDLFYAQANPSDGASIADNVVTNGVGTLGAASASLASNGDIDINVNPVPVPAAAWLFGSALAGLSIARRRK